MSAYSQAANGFVVSDRVTLMLDMLDDDVRARVLNHAYKKSRSMKCEPLNDAKENTAANAVYVAALEIAKAFQPHAVKKFGAHARLSRLLDWSMKNAGGAHA